MGDTRESKVKEVIREKIIYLGISETKDSKVRRGGEKRTDLKYYGLTPIGE